MTAAHLFQDFSEKRPKSTSGEGPAIDDLEDQKLDAFEKGFQAGWEDAVAAQAETQSFVSSGLASSLQNASFEYHELRATMSASIEAILKGVIDIILPQIAQASLGSHIRQTLQQLAVDGLERRIEIVVAPENEAAVRHVLQDEIPEPFDLVTDPLLASSQVMLRAENNEVELHLDRAVAEISAAIASFFDFQPSEVNDG